ncbi:MULTISPECIES: hypothetical protein [Streptomyces]|uniref:Large membrane protein n=1 Tax=Streptomyces glycanivorans TaxID=3033808 RepID=A0ABY9JGY1_9ACTN|nr:MULTISPECIES: hypothetical protein [unclassified Streptomyces]WLQ66982.1 hypothetical protein P8A20_26930 [Streptomyces sp. Alt3]WSQ87735.1 hypothetical protein OG722_26780 [Streptomyces sp. NBC_01212]WSR06257.1 hypothetical protein OG265_09685 [Streptomyces sp. NBC_01208]
MSTEQPDSDVTGPRRRRSPFAVASVAAAVLLAGGGAAYWASTASGGGTDAGRAASGDSSPPPLALDLADSSSTQPPGIAPGEPDPHGGGVVYRASGELPDGPDSAAVHRAEGTVTAAEVARLAKALGVRGAPHTDGTAWKVGSDGDGSGPVLKVVKQAPGTWTFARYGAGGPDACEPGPACAKQDRTPPSGPPVDEKAAKAAAAPVLKAAGQDGAALDADQLMGSVRVVNADPVVGGLPTYGWSTGIQVGAGGEIVGGSGHLKGLSKGDTYPVTGADEALEQLNAESRQSPKGGVGGCATSVPLEDDLAPQPDCSGGTPPVTTVTVGKAEFGLAARYTDGEQILVPSWLFSVEPAGGGPGNTIVQVAVDPDHLTDGSTGPSPTPTKDPAAGDAAITSYSADGRTLEVTFWGGVCSTYAARASEDGTSVRVTVTESKPDPGKACIMIAKELTRTVTLDTPLDGRKVVDAASGETVPRA